MRNTLFNKAFGGIKKFAPGIFSTVICDKCGLKGYTYTVISFDGCIRCGSDDYTVVPKRSKQ